MVSDAILLCRYYLSKAGVSAMGISLAEGASSYKYDLGLREYFDPDFDYVKHLRSLVKDMKEEKILYVSDTFECQYAILELPEKDSYYIVGPYLRERLAISAIQKLFPAFQETSSEFQYILRFYSQIPVMPLGEKGIDWLIYALARAVYKDKIQFTRWVSVQETLEDTKRKRVGPEGDIYLSTAEELRYRYKVNEEIVRAVAKGSIGEALPAYKQFRTLSSQQRFQDLLLDEKKWLVIRNAELKMAAYQAGVEPFYLHDISSKYAYAIEALTSAEDSRTMEEEMIVQYCLLVRNTKSEKYSPLINRVVTYIGMDLGRDLSLSTLANIFSVNASYLSARFKKETGNSLSQYVLQKRIKTAARHLRNTTHQINDICAQVGFYDTAYFSKSFKQVMGVSPSEYRKQSERK